MKKIIMILVCLMAMAVSVNGQDVFYHEGKVAITTSNTFYAHKVFYEDRYRCDISYGLMFIPIESIDEFVSFLEGTIPQFEKYQKLVESLDISPRDNTKVMVKGLHFKAKIGIQTYTNSGWALIRKIRTYDKNVVFKVYCKTIRRPKLIISGECYGENFEISFESVYDIKKLIDKLNKDKFIQLTKEEKHKEELKEIEKAKEAKRKEQVESTLQNAFN